MPWLFVLALLLAWPTLGLSLVAWCALAWFRAASQSARIRRMKEMRDSIEPLFSPGLDKFFLALDMPVRKSQQVTAQDAETCGRHILNYLSNNPSEAAIFIRGAGKHAQRSGSGKLDAVDAAMWERMCAAPGDVHVPSYRAVVAITRNNPSIRSFDAINLQAVAGRIDRLERKREAFAKEPTWAHVIRDWLAYETCYIPEGREPSAATLTQLSSLVLGSALYPPEIRCRRVPSEISRLSRLRALHLQYNAIEELPGEIGQLADLHDLKLGGNLLRALPPEIGDLEHLEVLSVWRNQLRTLPPQIGKLRNLKGLSLWGNPLAALPEEITLLRSLQRLELFDVPNLTVTERQAKWLADLESSGCKIECDLELDLLIFDAKLAR